MKKRPFLLVEFLLALSIAALICSALFRFFVSFSHYNHFIEKKQKKALEKNFCFVEIHKAISKISINDKSPYTQKKKNDQLSFLFSFDNGIALDPAFSGKVLGKLYLKNKALTLQIRSLENNRLKKNYTLLTDVEHMHFSFLGRSGFEKAAKPVGKSFAWYHSWPKNRFEIPTQIRLSLSRKNLEKLDFAFFVPSKQSSMLYL